MTIIKSEKFGRGKAAQRIDPEAVDPEMRRALGDLASSVMTIDDRVAYYADKLGIYDSGPYLQLPEKMMDKVRAYMVVKHGMRHDEFMEMPFPEILRILKGDAEALAELDRLPAKSIQPDTSTLTETECELLEHVPSGGKPPITGSAIAKLAGRDNGSPERTALSNLKKRGIIDNKGHGYFRP